MPKAHSDALAPIGVGLFLYLYTEPAVRLQRLLTRPPYRSSNLAFSLYLGDQMNRAAFQFPG